MTPLEEAKSLFAGGQRSFEADLAWYLQNGYVFSTPDHFIMGAPNVAKDGWFIHVAVGRGAFKTFLKYAPYPLKYVIWDRVKKGVETRRIYEWDRIVKMIEREETVHV